MCSTLPDDHCSQHINWHTDDLFWVRISLGTSVDFLKPLHSFSIGCTPNVSWACACYVRLMLYHPLRLRAVSGGEGKSKMGEKKLPKKSCS